MRKNLMHDKSKDGSRAPVSVDDEGTGRLRVSVDGRERLNGREVFHITFGPKDKSGFSGWKGNAYVDTTAYQPVLVTTEMARKIPFAVRTFLARICRGWGLRSSTHRSPMACGFRCRFQRSQIHVLFFFNRTLCSTRRTGSSRRHM